jgi:hypothetical protein
MAPVDRRGYLADAGVAFALFLAFIALTRLGYTPLGIPGYLLVRGFDAPQNAMLPGLSGAGYTLTLGLYLVGLAAVAGGIAGWLRGRFATAGPLRYGLVGGLITLLLLLLGVGVVILVSNIRPVPTPVAIAVAVGLVGLWAGRRVAFRRENES